MAEIKTIYEMGSFIHILKCVNAKIAEKKDGRNMNLKRVLIFIRPDLTILNSLYHVNTDWILSVIRDWNSIRIHVKPRATIRSKKWGGQTRKWGSPGIYAFLIF